MSVTRMRDTIAGERRYYYRGYRIIRRRRDWSARGFPQGVGVARDNPLIFWDVYLPGESVSGIASVGFPTRREAVAWIDEQEARS